MQKELKIATVRENHQQTNKELPDAYHRDGSIYITKREVLLQQYFVWKSTSFIESSEFYKYRYASRLGKAEQMYKNNQNNVVRRIIGNFEIHQLDAMLLSASNISRMPRKHTDGGLS
jgi:hypothetical protein